MGRTVTHQDSKTRNEEKKEGAVYNIPTKKRISKKNGVSREGGSGNYDYEHENMSSRLFRSSERMSFGIPRHVSQSKGRRQRGLG